MKQEEIEKILKKAKELGINFDLKDLGDVSNAELKKDKDGESHLVVTYTKEL
ncbi:MAG: hypothetical protein V1649_02075 [Patescibacteria group bacterium]